MRKIKTIKELSKREAELISQGLTILSDKLYADMSVGKLWGNKKKSIDTWVKQHKEIINLLFRLPLN